MDYFQGVVTDYLRAKRSRFVNTEYMINLDVDGIYGKDRHWYCDTVAIDFADSTIHLCEITYAKTLHPVSKRLQFWCNHWSEVVAALYRDSSLKGDWEVSPRVFIPFTLKKQLTDRVSALKWPEPVREANAYADRHDFGGSAPVEVPLLERRAVRQ